MANSEWSWLGSGTLNAYASTHLHANIDNANKKFFTRRDFSDLFHEAGSEGVNKECHIQSAIQGDYVFNGIKNGFV